MSYLQDRKRNIRNKKIIGIFCIVILFLIVVNSGPEGIAGKALRSIGIHLWKSQNALSQKVDDSGFLIRTKKSVFLENQSLKTRNEELVLAMTDYQIIKKENEELKTILGKVNTKGSVVLGTILAKPNKSLYDTLVLDVGINNGVEIGDVVWAGMEFPLGKITVANEHTSVVTLFSSAGFVTDAQIDSTNTSVDLVGRGGNNFEISVPHDLNIPSGSFAVIPTLGSKIVAIVVDIIFDPHEPMNKIILKSPVNIQDLKWVEVRKN